MQDFNCTVTSTWTNNDDNREFHTWRAWGSWVRKKQLDYVMGPKDTRSMTWYLNQVRFRTWDHCPVITKIEGREFKIKRRVKSWAGWAPVSEAEKAKFQSLFSFLEVTMAKAIHMKLRRVMDWPSYMTGWRVLLQRSRLPRLRQGTGTKFCVPKETRRMASDAAKSQDPVKRRH